jgi:hypothetical protein
MAGKALRLYSQAVNGGLPVAMDPEIYLANATISPDGKLVAGSRDRTTVIVPASGGTAHEIPTPFPAAPVAWSSDGGILYVRDLSSHRAARIARFDLMHSSVRPWKELAPADKGGLDYVMNAVISPRWQVVRLFLSPGPFTTLCGGWVVLKIGRQPPPPWKPACDRRCAIRAPRRVQSGRSRDRRNRAAVPPIREFLPACGPT